MSRIVVAGEEPTLLCVLECLLGPEGHEIFLTDHDGLVSEIVDVGPDLIICDLGNANPTNIQHWRAANALNFDPQVIIISSSCEESRYLEIMANGAFRVVTKPFMICELFAAVERSLILRNALRLGNPPAHRATKVLVVNDEPSIVDVILTCLPMATDFVPHDFPNADPSHITRALGLDREYAFHKAYDGDEAIRLLPDLNPDLIITNRKMPEIGGIDVLRAAKQYDPGIEVIVETAGPTPSTLDLSLTLGAWDYVSLVHRIASFAVKVTRALDYASIVGGRSPYHFLQPSELERRRETRHATLPENAGWTPIHSAVLWSRKDLLRLLLAEGLSPDAKDDQGRTPLHWATRTNQIELVEMLIDHGAHVDAQDNRQKTPLELAKEQGVESVINLLSSRDERNGG